MDIFDKTSIGDFIDFFLDVAVVIAAHGADAAAGVEEDVIGDVADAYAREVGTGPSEMVAVVGPAGGVDDGFGKMFLPGVDIERIGEYVEAVAVVGECLARVVVDGGSAVFPFGPEVDEEVLALVGRDDVILGQSAAHLQGALALSGCGWNDGVGTLHDLLAQTEGIALDVDFLSAAGQEGECHVVGIDDDEGELLVVRHGCGIVESPLDDVQRIDAHESAIGTIEQQVCLRQVLEFAPDAKLAPMGATRGKKDKKKKEKKTPPRPSPCRGGSIYF